MQELIDAINNLIDFDAKKTIGELRSLKSLKIEDDIVNVEIYLTDVKSKEADEFKKTLVRLVKLTFGYKGIKMKFIPITSKGTIFDSNVKFLLIGSGKGGVGKSSVSANLAVALARIGKKVGLIDADIYGASIANIMDNKDEDGKVDEMGKVYPFIKYGVEFISTDYFVEENRPLMWRGPMLKKMLEHYFYEVNWSNDLDYLLIDLPPGTGDVAIDIGQMIPNGKMILVTTPHPNASKIAYKAGAGAKEMNQQILGVVENMSYYINPVSGDYEYIFGKGGGLEVSKLLDTNLLAQISIDQPKGSSKSIFDEYETNGQIFLSLAAKIVEIY